jgi:LacI family transcriptional regulator
MRTATLADVARRAGVSIQTVSRVINGQAETSETTRARVLQAIADVDYRPNTVARGLRNRQTFTVGVVVPQITNPFFPEIIQGIEEAAGQAGYAVILSSSGENVELESELLRVLDARRVDGIIVCSPRQSDAALTAGLARYRAAVVSNRPVKFENVGVIRVDYESGARTALDHLLSLGRRRVAYAAIPSDSFGGRERRQGFLAAALDHGLGDLKSAIYEGAPTVDGGIAATRRLLQAQPDVDGIIFYNDLTAAGGLITLRESGRTVPGDIAVIGCDDIPFASMFSPSLTTLRIDKLGIGRQAMNMLREKMKGGRHSPLIFQPQLIVRTSSEGGV